MSTFNTAITIKKMDGNIDDWQTAMTGQNIFEQVGDYRFRRISDQEVVFFVNKDRAISFYVPDCSKVKIMQGNFEIAACSCCGGAV